jgi:hypothetical protein
MLQFVQALAGRSLRGNFRQAQCLLKKAIFPKPLNGLED